MAEHRRGARNAASMALRGKRRETLAERDHLLEQLSTARREGAADDVVADLRGRAEALDEHAEALARQLREEAPAEASLELPSGVLPGQVAAALGEHEVLVEFADGAERLYAYVLRDGRLAFHDLGTREAIDAAVEGYLAGMSRPGALAPVETVARDGHALYQALLAPLVADVPADAPLVIVPSAHLSELPFEALVAEAGDSPRTFEDVTFVLDRREVTYAPSTPVLALLADVGPRAQPGPALILADPVYAAESGQQPLPRGPRPGFTLSRLPGTRTEALAIAAVLEQAATGGHGTTGDLASRTSARSLTLDEPSFSLHVGEDARPGLMRGDLRRYGVIHCASHGWVDTDDPRRSGLLLSPGADGDGLLGVADILELDLDADLAVLSACETGRGAIRRGEGVQSLARAFLYAGARSVVASLWQVDDHETELLMTDFYGGFAGERAPAARALREARLALRHDAGGRGAWRGLGRGLPLTPTPAARQAEEALVGHPYFWAPFVFVGLPR
jgi:CHAT domain-containing protein